MSSLNKIILIGNLTQDVDIRETTNGHLLSRFAIAVERPSGSEQLEKQVDFIQVVAWRELAEKTRQLHKGNRVMVDGKIITRNYEDDNGKRIYVTEVEAREVHPLLKGETPAPVAMQDPSIPEAPAAPSLETMTAQSPVNFDFSESADPFALPKSEAPTGALGTDVEENIPF